MQTPDDMSLVREFAGQQNEAAFEALVTRHVNLVYSAALRQVGDALTAEGVTQAVFIILARKAGSFRRETFLTGWLFKTTRYAAAAELRARVRRLHRETQAYMDTSQINEEEAWPQIGPLLDEALASLGETDRRAVLLRYFENKPLAEVGAALGVNEDAARKRVTRGLEKLRKLFGKRGVKLTATVIASVMGANSVQAAPMGLAVKLSVVAAKGAATTASITTLVKGTMKMMTWVKIKFAVGVSLVALLVGGTVTVALSGDKDQRFLYVCEGHQQRVRVLDRQTLTEIPQAAFGHVGQYREMFLGLHVIITDAKGNIYTGDGRDGRVLRFNFAGLVH